MNNIIVLSDIQKYKHIYTALKGETNLDGYIQEAQQCDLKAWLGDALLMQLAEQRSTGTLTDANKLLLYGGKYTFDGSDYYCDGIATYMAYCVHARYVMRSSVSITQFGAVVKESDYSTPASGKQIAEIKNMSEQSAEAVKQGIVLFLDRMKADYPLYKNGNQFSGRRSQIRVIGE